MSTTRPKLHATVNGATPSCLHSLYFEIDAGTSSDDVQLVLTPISGTPDIYASPSAAFPCASARSDQTPLCFIRFTGLSDPSL